MFECIGCLGFGLVVVCWLETWKKMCLFSCSGGNELGFLGRVSLYSGFVEFKWLLRVRCCWGGDLEGIYCGVPWQYLVCHVIGFYGEMGEGGLNGSYGGIVNWVFVMVSRLISLYWGWYEDYL